MSQLVKGNLALRENKFETAIVHYLKALQVTPGLGKTIAGNLAMAKQKYRTERDKSERQRVAVCGWELSHNSAGRVYTLAKLYETFADVEIIGSIFSGYGREIWEPIRNITIPCHTFIVEDEGRFLDQAIALVTAHPYDIVHLSKPRAPNIFFGILYKLIWDAKVLIDIDDEELAFVGAETAISIEDYLKSSGKLPEMKGLDGKDWTRIAVGLAKEFDGITVSNPALQQRYGGEIIRHARDEKLYQPSPELKRKSREKFGIPQDKKVVLFFGTPREHKGLLETADAIASLKRKDLLFVIVGDFSDPQLKAKLLEKKGVDYVFISNQPFDSIPDVVVMGDICVLLQDPESPVSQFQVPAKLSDALGMGLVIIANNLSTLSDLSPNISFIDANFVELGKAIKNILDDNQFSDKKIIAGKTIFLSNFTINSISPLLKIFLAGLPNTRVSSALKFTGFSSIEALYGINSQQLVHQNPQNTAIELINGSNKEERIYKDWHSSLANSLTPALFGEHVDIVIPVFNALEDVKICLASVQSKKDGCNVTVYVVNDGSDQLTTNWLRQFCSLDPMFKLTENQHNIGYTKTVNVGLKLSKAPYVITLNSDTIVTNGWLKGLIRCMDSSPKVGIVGPLSNAASWQNVPELYDNLGKFAINALPPDFDADKMAAIVSSASDRNYPRMPFVNGFCFMITRQVIDAIGYMDEVNFPLGYGEENDFCIRAGDAGFELAIADDTYVYHAKSKSFGHEKRQELCLQGEIAIKRKHGEDKFKGLVGLLKERSFLDKCRKNITQEINRADNHKDFDVLSVEVLFLLPVGGEGGGIHSIVQEVAAMRRIGVSARVAIREQNREEYYRNYRDIRDYVDLFEVYNDFEHLVKLCSNYNVILATLFSSVEMLKKIYVYHPNIVPGYYAQDYEPLFFESNSTNYKIAYDSYNLIPDILIFAKTHWIANKIKTIHGIDVKKVLPSLDHEVYKPVRKPMAGKINIAAMIRPQTPRRGADRTMRLFSRLDQEMPGKFSFHIFGCNEGDESFQKLKRDFQYENHGVLKRAGVANILSKADIFIDLSDYQAFGRTALEAMASGCVSIVPVHGGTDEFAVDEVNSLIVDPYDEDACFQRTKNLLCDKSKIRRLQAESLLAASSFSTHKAALSELVLFYNELIRRGIHLHVKREARILLMPQLMGNGRPAGSGYVRLIDPYANANLDNYRINWSNSKNLPVPGIADVIFIQRDMGGIDLDEITKWMGSWKEAGGRIIYEIDDNLMDRDAIKLRTHRTDQQTQELVDRVKTFATMADLVTVSMPALLKVMEPYCSSIKLVPNFLDENKWLLSKKRPIGPDVFIRKENDPIRIGYIGTPTHDQDLEIVKEAILMLEKEFGKAIEVEVIGAFDRIKPMFGKKVNLPKVTEYPNFVEWLGKRVHWDIGIIPLKNDNFNKSKSFLKFLEYSALNLAIVCSDVETYSYVARHGENCLVTSNDKTAWYQAIKKLIEDSVLRNALAERAHTDLVAKYTIQGNTSLYDELISTVISGSI